LTDKLFAYIGLLGWELISLDAVYVWSSEPLNQGFRYV
jgi:hypothetical protein